MKRLISVFFVTGCLAWAQPSPMPAPSIWERDTLSGDWGGLRSSWEDRGVDLTFEYTAETFGVLSGGARRGTVYEGLGLGMLDADLEKLIGWRNFRFRVSTLWTHGASPTAKLAGDELTVSNIDAFDSLRLYETWLEHDFADDKLSLRVGNLLSDEEFAVAEYGSVFMNDAFGQPAFIGGNTLNTGPAFNVPALGVRLRYDPSEKIYLQAGVYDGDTFDDANGNPHVNQSGLHFKLSGSQGWFSIYEIGYRHNQAEGDAGLPGLYRIGAWHHTGTFARHNGGNAGDIWGVYFSGDQMVWREAPGSEQGLGVFYRVGGGPRDRSRFQLVMDTGLNYRGPLPGRDEDIAGLGLAYAKHSDDLATDHEFVIEATYSIQIAPWWVIQPDLQYISRPGGGTTPDAWAAGLRAVFSF